MPRIGKVSVAAAIGAALLGAGCVSNSDTDPQQFMALLKTHRFTEAAAEFYYEPKRTAAQVAKDKAGIVRFMETLFVEVGDIQSEAPLPEGAYTSWTIGVTGADRPSSASDVGADNERLVVYVVQLSRGGSDWLAWKYVHIQGQWKVLNFQFEIPQSEDDGRERIAVLATRLFPPAVAAKIFPPETQHAQ